MQQAGIKGLQIHGETSESQRTGSALRGSFRTSGVRLRHFSGLRRRRLTHSRISTVRARYARKWTGRPAVAQRKPVGLICTRHKRQSEPQPPQNPNTSLASSLTRPRVSTFPARDTSKDLAELRLHPSYSDMDEVVGRRMRQPFWCRATVVGTLAFCLPFPVPGACLDDIRPRPRVCTGWRHFGGTSA